MEEVPIETPKENTLPKSQSMTARKNNNAPLVGAIIFLALVIGAAAIYLGNQKNNEIAVAIPTTPTPSIATQNAPSSPISVSPAQDITLKWETANTTKMKDLSFVGYSIKHQAEWVAKESKNEVSQTLTITKGGNEIKIYQAPTGGAMCLFEDPAPKEMNFVGDYRNQDFTEIITNAGTIRRVKASTQDKDFLTYIFCFKGKNIEANFGAPTIFGDITYKTPANPNPETLSEMDKIISTLKALQ